MAAAKASHHRALRVIHELMREFVQRQHAVFLQSKVDAARTSVHTGQGRSNEAVEADFAARRARITDRV